MSPSGLLSKPEFFRYLHLASSSVVAPASHNSGEEEHIKVIVLRYVLLASASGNVSTSTSTENLNAGRKPMPTHSSLNMPSASPRAIVNQDIDLTWL
ncbi:unnamed protein product [Fusarium fujikuroi]|nr:unnamed protein product [Fusarium fujikuroi]